ncbi:hypothetical protein [Goekera deserti]|uniref:hypothetical protein n=1 Tax=Goekera deserti TaxID=2497753 RepID=UPI00192E8462|nr:hypothetical protein [Goekera deserti]
MPVSAGLLADVDGDFAALTAYRAGDLTPIVDSFTQGTLTAITNAARLVEELRTIRAGWDAAVRARSGAGAWRVADLLVRQPVLGAATIAREVGIPAQNAVRVIEPLVTAGVLTEFTGRRRDRRWQSCEVLDALDAFAARAGRRTTG